MLRTNFLIRFVQHSENPARNACAWSAERKQQSVLEMIMQKLEAHYSVLALISGVALCVGFSLFFCFVAGQMRTQNWLTTVGYASAAIFGGVALTFFYRLLTAKGRVVVSIDTEGFKDIRFAPRVIPWSAIRSVSPYILYKQTTSTGVALVMDPAFKRGLSIQLGAKLFNWSNLNFGSEVYIDARTLDIDSDEIARAAQSYISKQA